MSNSNLQLQNIVLKIGAGVIDQNTLDQDFTRWNGTTFMPGIGASNFDLPDLALMRLLGYEYMPFTLSALSPTIVIASLARFPYSINGNLAFQAFSVRMWPEEGQIKGLVMHKNHRLAVNAQDYSRDGVILELGNRSLRLEVFFDPIDMRTWVPLQPPAGFQPEVNFDPNDYN